MTSKPNAKPPPNSAPGEPEISLAQAVRQCRQDRLLLRRLREIYRQVDAAVAELPATCLGGGACCKFDLAGHRLYVSTGELALLMEANPIDLARCSRRRCPYQLGPRCMAREVRPLGCRTFFCGEEMTPQLHESYEHFHHLIRAAHQTHWRPYAYVELTFSLPQLLTLMR